MLQVCLSYISDSTLFIDCVKSQITHHGKQVQIVANEIPLRVSHTKGRKLVPIQLLSQYSCNPALLI